MSDRRSTEVRDAQKNDVWTLAKAHGANTHYKDARK
jgi:hypothetical protein